MSILTADEIKAMRAKALAGGASIFFTVLRDVAAEFGVSAKDILSPSRVAKVARARAWVCRCACDRGVSRASIARRLNRDPSSVSAAIATTHKSDAAIVFKSRRTK